MKAVLMLLVIAGPLMANSALAHDTDHHEKAESGGTPKGYVLKPGEGETLGTILIKASSKSGTQGGVMGLDQMPAGVSTPIHIHPKGDEFFYVLSGEGVATLSEQDVAIGPGDVVFVPEGARHAISVNEDAIMELIIFMDEPGLAGFFREAHALLLLGKPISVEDCNAIGAKHNVVCITP